MTGLPSPIEGEGLGDERGRERGDDHAVAGERDEEPRQSRIASSWEPMTGARIGASPVTSASRESIRTSACPPKRSRTIAIATTPPPAAPIPWRTRNTRIHAMSGDAATPMLAPTWSPVASSSGSRRPNRSLHGPITSWPTPNPIIVAVR